MPSLRDAWLRGRPEAVALLDDGIADAERRVEAVEAASRERLHADVREALRAQNAAARASGGVAASLAKLDQPGVSVVVTGQQVGLFGGPLYALHKACAAVRLARRLERESGRPVVPVFWLQSEDHDRREIASATLWDAEGDAVVVRAAFDAEARSSVAHDRRIEGVARARAGAVDAWRGQPFEAEARALLDASWTDDRGWVDAFASFAQAMLGDEGLLVFSPRTARLAERAKEVHAWATREHVAVATALERRADELARAGFASQVPLRPDCCLSFVHPDGVHGDRFRLRRRGAAWEAAGASARYTDQELTDLIASEPLRFSSSALLRPLVQDTLLPVAAYVGGAAEVAYLAQNEPLYALRGQRRPLVVARPHLLWVDPATRTTLEGHGLAPVDLAGGLEGMAARLGTEGAPGPSPEELRRRLHASFEATLDAIAPELVALDPSLERALRRTRETVLFGSEKLAEKVERARFRTLRSTWDALEDARRVLFPADVPQERTLGPLALVARLGRRVVVERALEAACPVRMMERARDASTDALGTQPTEVLL